MDVYEGFNKKNEEILKLVYKGGVFIYPTDTIYGIGCDATNSEAVKRIRVLKKRDEKPFSVIVPSKEWIRKNCVVDKGVEKWLKKLPGPYTLVLKLKNESCVVGEVNNFVKTLGVRIPNHYISKFVEGVGRPIITTSVNFTGEESMSSLDDLSKEIEKGVDFCIYEGEKKGCASTVVLLLNGEYKIIER